MLVKGNRVISFYNTIITKNLLTFKEICSTIKVRKDR